MTCPCCTFAGHGVHILKLAKAQKHRPLVGSSFFLVELGSCVNVLKRKYSRPMPIMTYDILLEECFPDTLVQIRKFASPTRTTPEWTKVVALELGSLGGEDRNDIASQSRDVTPEQCIVPNNNFCRKPTSFFGSMRQSGWMI